jgi:hypothetical protein
VRRDRREPGAEPGVSLIRSMPIDCRALILMDATGSTEACEAVLRRPVQTWPDGPLPRPRSEVVQVISRKAARYPLSTLWREGRPTKACDRIAGLIRSVGERLGVPMAQTAVVTHKRVEGRFAELLPNARIRHFPARGVNDLSDVRILHVVGVPELPGQELARRAVVLRPGHEDPAAYLKELEEAAKAEGAWRQIDPGAGEAWEIRERDLHGALRQAWELSTQAQIVQAIGRARPHAESDAPRWIYVWGATPLPEGVVTRIVPMEDLARRGRSGRGASPALRPDREQEVTDMILKTLKDSGGMSVRDLRRACGAAKRMAADELEAVLQSLSDRGKLVPEREVGTRGGRPSTKWRPV